MRDGQGRYAARATRGAICFPEGEKEGRHFEGISILSRKRGGIMGNHLYLEKTRG